MFPKEIENKIVSTEKIDNGDGSYTVIDTYQYKVSNQIKTIDIQNQIVQLQQKLVDIPKGALPKEIESPISEIKTS